MAIRSMRIYGDPVLRTKCADVTEFDDSLRQLVDDMHETMQAYQGVGLAANQIGVTQRVFVIDVPIDEEHRVKQAIVNPVIDRREGSETAEEGCLSMPGIYEDISRSLHVRVRGLDERGRPVEIQADGYLARAIQHEADHLNGVLFTDRLSPLKRQFLKKSLDALARGEVPEDYHPGSTKKTGGGSR
jgi:peptide deformylase